jgi:hypothetical protein
MKHHGHSWCVVLAAMAAVTLLETRPSSAPVIREAGAVQAFMRTNFGVTTDDLTRVNSGVVVTRSLPASGARDVTTFGIVRIAVPAAFYVSHLENITSFKRDDAVLQIGTFGTAPALRDVAGLTLDESDLKSLRNCRVGRCSLQLPASGIQRLHQGIDWQRSDAREQAQVAVRQVLVDFVSAYVARGAAASMRYADGPVEMDTGREFASMAQSPSVAWDGITMLREHLLKYPAPAVEPTRDQIYWSKEKVAGRGVVSITHLAVTRLSAESFVEYAVSSKQIYGSHYYDASLGTTFLICDRTLPMPATYVIYLNQSRIDLLETAFGSMIRNIIKSRARSTVATRLEKLQRTLEDEFRQ